MTTWLSTEQVREHLGISKEILTELMTAPVDPPFTRYAGRAGSPHARYRWRSDRVDAWFEEAAAWRTSKSETVSGLSGGEREDGDRSSSGSPSEPSDEPIRSPRRSKTTSSDTAGSSHIGLVKRLLSGR